MQYYLQEYQEARKAISQEHQRHKLVTIPTTTPTTTSTTTAAMTPTRTTPMRCLAQGVEKSLYFMQKVFFCRNKIKKIKKIIIKKKKKMIQNETKRNKKKQSENEKTM